MRVGDVHVGVRFDDPDLLDRAIHAYEEHAVVDPEAVDDLSVVLHPPVRADVARRRPSLRHGGCDLLRSASGDRLLRALDAFLATAPGPPEGLVRIRGLGSVVVDERAALVPEPLLHRSSGVERLLLREGAQMADGVSVFIDPAATEVVVHAGLAGDERLGIGNDLLARPGRYSLRSIHWLGSEAPDDESAAVGVVRLLNRAEPPASLSTEAGFNGLVGLADRFSSVRVGERGVSDVGAVLAALGP